MMARTTTTRVAPAASASSRPAEGNAADGEPRARRSLVRDVFHLTPRLFGFLADLVREIEPPGRPAPATLNGSRKLSK